MQQFYLHSANSQQKLSPGALAYQLIAHRVHTFLCGGHPANMDTEVLLKVFLKALLNEKKRAVL